MVSVDFFIVPTIRVSIKATMEQLAAYMRRWRAYFGFREMPEVLVSLTRWVRLRLQAVL